MNSKDAKFLNDAITALGDWDSDPIRDAAVDGQDWCTAALCILSDSKTADLPWCLVTDLWNIGISSDRELTAIEVTKIQTALAWYEREVRHG